MAELPVKSVNTGTLSLVGPTPASSTGILNRPHPRLRFARVGATAWTEQPSLAINASCTVAALWPERIGGLVSYAGYDIIDVSGQRHPVSHLWSASAGISIFSRPSADANA